MTRQVQGKVALVTGGASGIGEAVSELLAREGASVAVTDVDDLKGPEVVARIKKAGGEAGFWHHDVTSEERWIEVVAEVMKRGVRLFAKAIAMECATFGDGIRVNSVHPGIIDTPIWGKIPAGAAGAGQNAPIDPEERAKLATPLGRAGHAEEIAQGVLYLASDASRYVTGTELVIDGGMNAGGVARR